MRNPIDSTGWVIRSDAGAFRFAGSCFGFRRNGFMVTAEHVVRGASERDVTVTILLQEVEEGLSVERIFRHPTADVAILQITDAIEIFDRFNDVAPMPDFGTNVTAFGYPEDTEPTGPKPTPRFFKGHVQRKFRHTSHLGYQYIAAELSFGAPGGLSGGPVALEALPSHAVGVVTENRRSTTFLETTTDVIDGQIRYREDVHSVINYGLCTLLEPLRGWLDECIPTE